MRFREAPLVLHESFILMQLLTIVAILATALGRLLPITQQTSQHNACTTPTDNRKTIGPALHCCHTTNTSRPSSDTMYGGDATVHRILPFLERHRSAGS